MQNKWVAYEIAKKNLEEQLYATCSTSEEFTIKREKGMQKIINLLKL